MHQDNSGEPATWHGPTICWAGIKLELCCHTCNAARFDDLNEVHFIVIQPRNRVWSYRDPRHVLSVVKQGYVDTAGVLDVFHYKDGHRPSAEPVWFGFTYGGQLAWNRCLTPS